MAFGISFGSNKTNIKSNTAIDKTEVGTQSGTTSQNQTQTGTTNTSGTQSTSGTTTTGGQQQQTTQQQTIGAQQTQQKTNLLSDSILAALESSTADAIAKAGVSAGPSASRLSDFNVGDFVGQGMMAAEAAQRAQLDQSLNGLFDSTGGTAGGNSMAALLANRLEGGTAANLAGVRANLTAQGESIQRDNVIAGLQADQTTQSLLQTLLGNLKGASASTTGSAQTMESSNQNTSGVQSQTQQNQQNVNTSQTSTETQNLMSIINQLMNNSSRTTGTEITDSTQKKSGGGFGLSI